MSIIKQISQGFYKSGVIGLGTFGLWASSQACLQAADLCPLNGSAKELVRLLHEVLVKWAVKRNVDGGGGLFPAPCPAGLLPQRRHRSCMQTLLMILQ